MPDTADNVPPTGAADDRWQDLMRSMDPVANLNALADVWRQAAASSEQVVGSFVSSGGPKAGEGHGTGDQGTNRAGEATGPANGDFGPNSRDLRIDFERSVDQMADAAKRFFAQMPWAQPAAESPAGAQQATVAVIDGIGTTEVHLPASEVADGQPWATLLFRHDGATIPDGGILIRSSPHFGSDNSAPTSAPGTRSFIVKVQTPADVAPGSYHGQILCPGRDDFVLPLEVRVYDGS